MRAQALFLVAVITLAGCIGQSTPTSTDGVIIKSVSANPPEIESRPGEAARGISTTLATVVQNVGELDAERVTIKLIGLSPEWGFTPNSVGRHVTCETDAFLPVGELPEADVCRYYKIGTLFAPDPERNLNEGQEEAAYWELQPPPNKAIEQTYEVGARLNYYYTTISDSVIRVVSTRYYQQTNNGGGISTSKNSGGPLLASLKVASFVVVDEPLIDVTTGRLGKVLPVQIELQNVGNGRVAMSKNEDQTEGFILRDPKEDEWDIVDVKVQLNNRDATNQCKLIDGRHLKLINGKSALLSCKLLIEDGVETYADIQLKFEFTYNYVTDSVTSVTVIPAVR